MFEPSHDVICKQYTMEFTNENVINAVQNHTLLWDTTVNASEDDKELAWKQIADLFGIADGNNFTV